MHMSLVSLIAQKLCVHNRLRRMCSPREASAAVRGIRSHWLWQEKEARDPPGLLGLILQQCCYSKLLDLMNGSE